ncbi:MAG: replication-relaxation family protein [Gaiellaceae bacterium]
MSRLRHSGIVRLADRLPSIERRILETAERLRLLRADQVRRLFFSEIESETGGARLCRRALAHLVEEGLLRRLERRVGGTRAGSSGHLYATTAAGARLLAYWNGAGVASNRGAHEPGAAFASHTLAIADLYVSLVEASRSSALELLGFETEPACWRAYTTALGARATLKPDALVRLAHGDYEYVSFVEIDCGTEGRGALLRKAHAFLSYFRTGREQAETGVFPRVVWIASQATRAKFLTAIFAGLPAEAQQLFVVGSTEEATALLTGSESRFTSSGGAR